MASKAHSKTAVAFLENKQLVHIVAEVVVLVGVVFYFSSKNKKLSSHIEELAQRIEEQEDRIQKLETTLQHLSSTMTVVVQGGQANSKVLEKHEWLLSQMTDRSEAEPVKTEPVRVKPPQKHVAPVEAPKPVVSRTSRVQFNEPARVSGQVVSQPVKTAPPPVMSPPEPEENDEDGSDSDLDIEIRTELDELDEETESSLKKQN